MLGGRRKLNGRGGDGGGRGVEWGVGEQVEKENFNFFLCIILDCSPGLLNNDLGRGAV